MIGKITICNSKGQLQMQEQRGYTFHNYELHRRLARNKHCRWRSHRGQPSPETVIRGRQLPSG